MGIKLFSWFLMLILLTNYSFAQPEESGDIRYDETLSITQIGNEVKIPYGKNATADLPMFSKTYIRIHEGSKLDFRILDPDTNAVLIKNSLIIKEVRPETTSILLSIDNSEYIEVLFYPGKDYNITYNYSFMPYILINQLITHYEEDSRERNVLLYFLVPFLKTSKSDFGQVKYDVFDLSIVSPESGAVSKEENKFNTIITLFIILALIILGFILFKKLKRR